MVDQNEITGARLVSKATTKKYADNWDKIFNKKQTIKPLSDAIAYDSDSSNDNLPPNYDSRSSYTREST